MKQFLVFISVHAVHQSGDVRLHAFLHLRFCMTPDVFDRRDCLEHVLSGVHLHLVLILLFMRSRVMPSGVRILVIGSARRPVLIPSVLVLHVDVVVTPVRIVVALTTTIHTGFDHGLGRSCRVVIPTLVVRLGVVLFYQELVIAGLPAICLSLIQILDDVDDFTHFLGVDHFLTLTELLFGPLDEAIFHVTDCVQMIHVIAHIRHLQLRQASNREFHVSADSDRFRTRVDHGHSIEVTTGVLNKGRRRDIAKSVCRGGGGDHYRLRQSDASQCDSQLDRGCSSGARDVARERDLVDAIGTQLDGGSVSSVAFATASVENDGVEGNRLARLDNLSCRVSQFNH
nr:MAG TPA: hypothetical protein [Caudoviricetes sp.]